MIGLLHRLASRAAGTSVAVRSDARLPFHGTGPGSQAVAPATEQSFASATRAPAPMARIGAAPLDGSQVDTPTPDVVPGAPPPPMAPRADPAPWAAVHAGRDPRAPFPDAAPRGRDGTVPPRMVDMFIDDGRASASRAGLEPEPADRSAAPHAPDAVGRDGAVHVVRDPPLLVPLVVSDRTPVSGALAATAMPAAAAVSPNGIRAEPGEVHIHIGRVEVTAVQEAPAQRRRSQPAPPPMSLDAYFATRGRG